MGSSDMSLFPSTAVIESAMAECGHTAELAIKRNSVALPPAATAPPLGSHSGRRVHIGHRRVGRCLACGVAAWYIGEAMDGHSAAARLSQHRTHHGSNQRYGAKQAAGRGPLSSTSVSTVDGQAV